MISNSKDLKAIAQAFYEATREAAIEYQKKPFDGRAKLNKTYALACRVAKLNGITVENLPIPKSIVKGAPQLTTPAAKKKKVIAPRPPQGDVLATNSDAKPPRTRRRRKASK